MENYADSIRSTMPQFYSKNTPTRSTEAIGRQEPLTNAGRTLRVDLSSRAGPVGHASASAVSQQQRPIETRTVSFNNTSGDRTTAETVSVYFRETLTEKLNILLRQSESNSHNIQDMRDELFRFRNEFMNTHRATDRLNSKLSTLSNKMHLIETDTRRLLEEVNLRAKDLEILTDKIGIDLLTAVDTTTDLEKTIKQIQSSKEDRTALKIHVSYLSMMADRLQKEKNRLLNDIDKLLTSNDGELKERVAKAKEALAKDECAESATMSHRESEDKTLWQRLKGLCFKRKFTICGVVGIPGGLSGAAVIYGIYLVVKGREGM
ncbi:hypothetical protein [Endozoicomonas atrinae]|uniref:hypothetical protein n=1 Tax=Endozoicomonas atrinae TaxID=1333660 RepID=UPI000ABD8503|nr:hypothetical protein [Endozoicomonas atrinae]